MHIESQQWKKNIPVSISWTVLNPLRLPSWGWACRGTPPSPDLFSVGSYGSTSLKALLPLPPDSSCASSLVSEVPKVFWGGDYAVCFPNANPSCKAELFRCCLNSCFGADSLNSTTLCFGLSPTGVKQYPSAFKNNAKCALPEIHVYLSCAIAVSPDASAHGFQLFAPFCLICTTIINSVTKPE